MDRAKRYWHVLPLTIAGALLGYVIGFAWEHHVKEKKPLLFAVLGALIGLLCLPVYRFVFSGRNEFELESAEIKVPFVGTTLKVKLNDAHKIVAWKLFVELSTRITSQSLQPGEGLIREALTSLYKVLDITRTELKTMRPTRLPVSPEDYTVESYAVLMLNDALRPFMGRWHPRLSKWERTALPEAEWPLAEYCRRDLEATRKRVLGYTWGFGKMLNVVNLARLLPLDQDHEDEQQLMALVGIETKEKEFDSSPSTLQREVGSHIYIELVWNLSSELPPPDTDMLREHLNSLTALDIFIRAELEKLPLQTEFMARESLSVEAVAMSLLTGPLRKFLITWMPRLQNFEKRDGVNTVWEKAEECRSELEDLRPALVNEAKRMGRVLGLSEASLYLP
jgi:hypothetical protein